MYEKKLATLLALSMVVTTFVECGTKETSNIIKIKRVPPFIKK